MATPLGNTHASRRKGARRRRAALQRRHLLGRQLRLHQGCRRAHHGDRRRQHRQPARCCIWCSATWSPRASSPLRSRRSWLGSSRGDWARGGLLGVFYLTALILQTIGLQRTSPGVSGFITGMSVAMVPFLYWFVARRSPGRWQIIGAVVATVGLGALSLQGDFTLKWGDALTLLGSLFYALHIMTTGFFAPKVKPTTLAVTQMAVSTLILVVVTPVLRARHARPAVAGVGGRGVDGRQRHHLRVLHPELGPALHDLDARRHPARLRERVRRPRRHHRRDGHRDGADCSSAGR